MTINNHWTIIKPWFSYFCLARATCAIAKDVAAIPREDIFAILTEELRLELQQAGWCLANRPNGIGWMVEFDGLVVFNSVVCGV